MARGPGSFTGVKIGISITKGLSFGLDIPVVGISTLEGLCYNIPYTSYFISPMILSRTGEVYTALYNFWGTDSINRIEPEKVFKVERWLERINEPTIFLGDGAIKYKSMIKERLGENAIFVPGYLNYLQGSNIAFQAGKAIQAGDVSSPFTLTAEYLRAVVNEKEQR